MNIRIKNIRTKGHSIGAKKTALTNKRTKPAAKRGEND